MVHRSSKDRLSPTAASPPAWQRGTAEVAGTRLTVGVANGGAGRPVLLLRGLGGAGTRWHGVLPHLADREAITFDLPGLGDSPASRWPRRMGWYADLAAGVVRAAGHRRVDVLGVSWGGALAQELTNRHPGVVDRLALVSTSAGLVAVPSGVGLAAETAAGLRRNARAQVRRTLGFASGDSGDPRTIRGLAAQAAAMTGWTSIRWLGRLETPTLVVAGAQDRVIPAVNARILASVLPDSRVHVLTGAGHDLLDTHADVAFAVLRRFLDDAPDDTRDMSHRRLITTPGTLDPAEHADTADGTSDSQFHRA